MVNARAMDADLQQLYRSHRGTRQLTEDAAQISLRFLESRSLKELEIVQFVDEFLLPWYRNRTDDEPLRPLISALVKRIAIKVRSKEDLPPLVLVKFVEYLLQLEKSVRHKEKQLAAIEHVISQPSRYTPNDKMFNRYYEWVLQAIEQDPDFDHSFAAIWLHNFINFPTAAKQLVEFVNSVRSESEAHLKLQQILKTHLKVDEMQQMQDLLSSISDKKVIDSLLRMQFFSNYKDKFFEKIKIALDESDSNGIIAMYSFFLYQSLAEEERDGGIWETTCSILHKFQNPEQIGAVYYLFKHLETNWDSDELEELKHDIARIVCQVCQEIDSKGRTTGRPKTVGDPGEPGEPWFALPFPLMETVSKRILDIGLSDRERERLGVSKLFQPVSLLKFPCILDGEQVFSYALTDTDTATNHELLPLCVNRSLRDDEIFPFQFDALKWSLATQTETALNTRLYITLMIMYGTFFLSNHLLQIASKGNTNLLVLLLLRDCQRDQPDARIPGLLAKQLKTSRDAINLIQLVRQTFEFSVDIDKNSVREEYKRAYSIFHWFCRYNYELALFSKFSFATGFYYKQNRAIVLDSLYQTIAQSPANTVEAQTALYFLGADMFYLEPIQVAQLVRVTRRVADKIFAGLFRDEDNLIQIDENEYKIISFLLDNQLLRDKYSLFVSLWNSLQDLISNRKSHKNYEWTRKSLMLFSKREHSSEIVGQLYLTIRSNGIQQSILSTSRFETLSTNKQDKFWRIVSPIVKQWFDKPNSQYLLEQIASSKKMYRYLPILSECAPVWQLFPPGRILSYVKLELDSIGREIAKRTAVDILVLIDSIFERKTREEINQLRDRDRLKLAYFDSFSENLQYRRALLRLSIAYLREPSDSAVAIIKYVDSIPAFGKFVIEDVCVLNSFTAPVQWLFNGPEGPADFGLFLVLQQLGYSIATPKVICHLLPQIHDQLPMIDFILRFSSWDKNLAEQVLDKMDPSQLVQQDKKILKMLRIMMRIKDIKRFLEDLLSQTSVREKWRNHVTLDEIRASAGVDKVLLDNIDKSARTIARYLLPEAGAVEMAATVPTDLVLPRYIYSRTYRPSGASLLQMVSAQLPDASEQEVQWIAVQLSQVYPWRMNDADVEWMKGMVSTIDSNPVNSREAAVSEYIQRCYREMSRAPLVQIKEPFLCPACFEEQTLAIVPPCQNYHDDQEAQVCFACMIKNIDQLADTKTSECGVCNRCIAPISMRQLLDLTLEPSREGALERKEPEEGASSDTNTLVAAAALDATRINQLLGSSNEERMLRHAKIIIAQDRLMKVNHLPSLTCPFCKADAEPGLIGTAYCTNTNCTASFCVDCNKRAHAPFSCASWTKITPTRVDLPPNIAQFLRACPNCGLQQAKDKACNKMVCGQDTHGDPIPGVPGCGTAYCFVCSQPWEPNHTGADWRCQMVDRSVQDQAYNTQFIDMMAFVDALDQRPDEPGARVRAAQGHLIALGYAYLKQADKFAPPSIRTVTAESILKKIAAQQSIVEMCMQRASDALAPDLGTTSNIKSVQQEHRLLEQYLPDPDCDVAIRELLREKKLDFLIYVPMGPTLESRVSDLLNPHCVQYLLAHLDKYQMQIVDSQINSLQRLLKQRAEGQSSDVQPKDVVKAANALAGEFLSATVLKEKESYVAEKLIETFFAAKLDDCFKQFEESMRARFKIIKTEELKRKDLSDCFRLYGPYAKNWSFEGSIEQRVNEQIQKDPIEYAKYPKNINACVPYEYAFDYIQRQKDRIQAEAIDAFARSLGDPDKVERDEYEDEIKNFPIEMRAALTEKLEKARTVLREVRGVLRQRPGISLKDLLLATNPDQSELVRWAYYMLVWIPEFKRTRGFGRLSFDFDPKTMPVEEEEDYKFVKQFLSDVEEQLEELSTCDEKEFDDWVENHESFDPVWVEWAWQQHQAKRSKGTYRRGVKRLKKIEVDSDDEDDDDTRIVDDTEDVKEELMDLTSDDEYEPKRARREN